MQQQKQPLPPVLKLPPKESDHIESSPLNYVGDDNHSAEFNNTLELKRREMMDCFGALITVKRELLDLEEEIIQLSDRFQNLQEKHSTAKASSGGTDSTETEMYQQGICF